MKYDQSQNQISLYIYITKFCMRWFQWLMRYAEKGRQTTWYRFYFNSHLVPSDRLAITMFYLNLKDSIFTSI